MEHENEYIKPLEQQTIDETLQPQQYLCVADGVGSWRQYGIDPRLFSHK